MNNMHKEIGCAQPLPCVTSSSMVRQLLSIQ